MGNRLPIRDNNSILESKSEHFFLERLPTSWFHDKPKDFGIDLIINIVNNNYVTGFNFSVQLKSSHVKNESLSVRLKRSTINYLFTRLEPVMIVFYADNQKEAYWKWLKEHDIDLTKANSSFEIKFNKTDRLSNIDWNTISNFTEKYFKRKRLITTSLNYDIINVDNDIEREAWTKYFSEQFDEASILFKRLLVSKKEVIWLLALSQCQYSVYNYKSALETIIQAEAIDSSESVLITKASILAEDGNLNNDIYKIRQAESIFGDLFKKKKTDVISFNYANTLSNLQEYRKAERVYKIALRKNPNYAEAWKNLGQVYYQLKKHDLEIECYDKALLVNPTLSEALISKGITIAKCFKKYSEGLNLIFKGASIKPESFVRFNLIHFWISYCYYHQNKIKESMEWINKGLALDPSNFQMRNFKTFIIANQWKSNSKIKNEGINFFRQNLEANPSDNICYSNYALIAGLYKNGKSFINDIVKWLPFLKLVQDELEIPNHQKSKEYIELIGELRSIKEYTSLYGLEKNTPELSRYKKDYILKYMAFFELARYFFFFKLNKELASLVKSGINVNDRIITLVKSTFLDALSNKVPNLVTTGKNNLPLFAKELSNILVATSEMTMKEIFRILGFLVVKNIEHKSKIDAIVESLPAKEVYISILLAFTESAYKHFELPMK